MERVLISKVILPELDLLKANAGGNNFSLNNRMDKGFQREFDKQFTQIEKRKPPAESNKLSVGRQDDQVRKDALVRQDQAGGGHSVPPSAESANAHGQAHAQANSQENSQANSKANTEENKSTGVDEPNPIDSGEPLKLGAAMDLGYGADDINSLLSESDMADFVTGTDLVGGTGFVTGTDIAAGTISEAVVGDLIGTEIGNIADITDVAAIGKLGDYTIDPMATSGAETIAKGATVAAETLSA
ncbi:MAG: hypothetical protein JKY67_07230, partial [Pseudomonadales bacterium]|nr:hypothetical protein [Pseudomonadales bacterium]